MARILPAEKQRLALQMLVEGNSLRSVTRLTGVHRTTVMDLLVRFGGLADSFSTRRCATSPWVTAKSTRFGLSAVKSRRGCALMIATIPRLATSIYGSRSTRKPSWSRRS